VNERDWVSGDPAALRAAYAAERAELDATAPPDVVITTRMPAGLRGLCFTPPGAASRDPVLYFHGGSWLLGSPATHRALCEWFAKLAGRRIISVEYPLAPEHIWPAQRDAARAAKRMLQEALGDGGRFFVAGDSAGGAMALWAAERDVHTLCGIAAFYPAFGLVASRSIDAYGPGNASLNAEAIAAMYRRLGAKTRDIQDAVPRAGAPTLILSAGLDPLRDDSTALARALSERAVTHWHASDEGHAFLHHGGSRASVRGWLTRVGQWMSAQP